MNVIEEVRPEDINEYINTGKIKNLEAGALEKLQLAINDLEILGEAFPMFKDKVTTGIAIIENSLKCLYIVITGVTSDPELNESDNDDDRVLNLMKTKPDPDKLAAEKAIIDEAKKINKPKPKPKKKVTK